MGQHCRDGVATLPFSLKETSDLFIRALKTGHPADKNLCLAQLQLIDARQVSLRCFESCFISALLPEHFMSHQHDDVWLFSPNFTWLWEIFLHSPISRKIKIEQWHSWQPWFNHHNATVLPLGRLVRVTADLQPLVQVFANQGVLGLEFFYNVITDWNKIDPLIPETLASEMGHIIAKTFSKGDIDTPYLLSYLDRLVNKNSEVERRLHGKILEQLFMPTLLIMKVTEVKQIYFQFFAGDFFDHTFTNIIDLLTPLMELTPHTPKDASYHFDRPVL